MKVFHYFNKCSLVKMLLKPSKQQDSYNLYNQTNEKHLSSPHSSKNYLEKKKSVENN